VFDRYVIALIVSLKVHNQRERWRLKRMEVHISWTTKLKQGSRR